MTAADYGYEEYRAEQANAFGSRYHLWGYDSGILSDGETEGWHYIGCFDSRDEPIPQSQNRVKEAS